MSPTHSLVRAGPRVQQAHLARPARVPLRHVARVKLRARGGRAPEQAAAAVAAYTGCGGRGCRRLIRLLLPRLEGEHEGVGPPPGLLPVPLDPGRQQRLVRGARLEPGEVVEVEVAEVRGAAAEPRPGLGLAAPGARRHGQPEQRLGEGAAASDGLLVLRACTREVRLGRGGGRPPSPGRLSATQTSPGPHSAWAARGRKVVQGAGVAGPRGRVPQWKHLRPPPAHSLSVTIPDPRDGREGRLKNKG